MLNVIILSVIVLRVAAPTKDYFCDFLMKKIWATIFYDSFKTPDFSLLARVTRRLDKKVAQIWGKVAQTIAKSRNAKIYSSKLNLKVQTIFTKPLLNSYKYLPYFIMYSAHFFTLEMMLKYSLCTICGR